MSKRKTIKEVLGILAGHASMCWDEMPKGIFGSEQAGKAVDTALVEIKALLPSVDEIFELTHKCIMNNSDKESRIWFGDTSWSISKAIHAKMMEGISD